MLRSQSISPCSASARPSKANSNSSSPRVNPPIAPSHRLATPTPTASSSPTYAASSNAGAPKAPLTTSHSASAITRTPWSKSPKHSASNMRSPPPNLSIWAHPRAGPSTFVADRARQMETKSNRQRVIKGLLRVDFPTILLYSLADRHAP